MAYERLTKRICGAVVIDDEFGNDISTFYKPLADAIERLGELEDKIEQGTLVDTESYFIVEENQWAGKNRFLVCQNAVQLAVCDFCESKEEAEKSLLELQGGKE